MLCTVIKLRSYIEDGKVEQLLASGCPSNGWHLSFDTLSGKVKLRSRRKEEPRVFKSGLALFKFVNELGLPLVVVNMKNKYENVATKLAAVYLVAQVNPDAKSLKEMCEAINPAYISLLKDTQVNIGDDKQLTEYAMDYMTSPALFVVGINSSILELDKAWFEPIQDLVGRLELMGSTEEKYLAHLKSVNQTIEKLSNNNG